MKSNSQPRWQMPGLARVVGVAVIVGAALGCTGNAADNQAVEDRPRHRVVECIDVIDVVPDPGRGYTAYGANGGFIALPSGPLQLGRFGPEGSGFEDYRFAKFGLLVRRSQQASLEIVKAPGYAFLEHGQGEFGTADALTAGPCDSHGPACDVDSAEYVGGWPCGADRGEWIVWAGGIWVDEPGCVDVLASSGDEEIPARLAVGTSCN